MSARARIRCSDQREARWIRDRLRRARDDDPPVFHRLAKRFENASRKLEHLVEKEHAAVSKADFAGTWRAPATDESSG
jgi:hypothetical protein